ncbi:MAG: T9SS type A sorting domain-containing protein [Candidatus Doudnabacteria bacterium]
MKQGRRDFLKNIAIISAGSLMLPKIFRANPMSTITVYVPELEGEKFTGSLVQVFDAGANILLGQNTTVNSETTITLTTTEVKNRTDNTGLLSNLNAQDNGGSIVVTYPVHRESKVQIGLYDITGREIWINRDYKNRGNYDYQIRINNLASGIYFCRVITEDYSGTMKLPIVEHRLAVPNNSIPYQSVVSLQSKKEIDMLDKIGSGDYKIIISNPNVHYTRTINTPSSDRIEDKVTGYVSQTDVTPALFKAFCKEMNFNLLPDTRSGDILETTIKGFAFDGLKTFLQQPNKVLWIGFEKPAKNYAQTPANQEYIKNVYLTKGFSAVSPQFQPAIYVVDQISNPEILPSDSNAKIVVVPSSYKNNFIYLLGKNNVINTTMIQIGGGDSYGNNSTWPDPAYDQKKLKFLIQSLCAPADTDNLVYNDLTILSTIAPTKEFSPMDKKLIKIAEYYQPKSAIDDILGL